MEDDKIIDDQDVRTEDVSEDEKIVSQLEINKIVARTKAATEKKVRKEMEDRYNNQEDIKSSPDLNNLPPEVISSLEQNVLEKINKQIVEAQQQQEHQERQKVADHVAQKYLGHLNSGREMFEDFDEVTKKFDPMQFPQLLHQVADMENAPEILYDLSQNPYKLGQIDYLLQRSPNLAQIELDKLANSIKKNREAQEEENNNVVNNPLNSLSSDRRTGGGGNKNMSVSDYQNMPWLRS